KHQDIAAQFQIRGIPAVKMVYQGKLIAEFSGALPEAQIRKWLDDHLPKNEKEEAGIEQVHALLEAGNRTGALEMVKDLFIDNPDNEEFRYILAMVLLPGSIDEAERVLHPLFKVGKYAFEHETIQSLKHAIAVYQGKEKLPEGGHPKTIESLQNGISALLNND